MFKQGWRTARDFPRAAFPPPWRATGDTQFVPTVRGTGCRRTDRFGRRALHPWKTWNDLVTILGRYIFRQSAGAVVLILASLTGVIWIAVALRQLNFITSQGQSSFVFLKMTSLALPTLLAFIAPIALLIAIVHTLNRLNTDSELIVTTAGGASVWRLLWPLMTLGVIVSTAILLTVHFLAPNANRHLRDLTMQARTDLISQVLQPGRFTSPEPRLTFHIRDKAPDGRLLGMLMHDARDEKQVTSFLAESGYLVVQGSAAYLVMSKGHILRTPPGGGPVEIVAFERYAVDINRFEQKADSGLLIRPRERTTFELLNPDPNDPLWRDTPQRFVSELHDRWSSGLYPLAFVLIALAFVGQSKTTRQNRTQSVIAAIGVGFLVRIVGISAVNASVTKASAIPWLYAIPVIASVTAIGLTAYSLRPRPPSRLAVALAAFNRRLLALVPRRGASAAGR
jgi:lipopolysaccharide export system permease protein